MKKLILIILTTLITLGASAQSKSLYDFKVTDINGQEFDMAQLKGKKVLIVNVASKCGLTPQYEKLQDLYSKYKDRDFVVVGFPANNFMGQEPGTDQEIKTFCVSKYDVSFPMMSKIDVKGNKAAPIYQWLTKKTVNGKLDAPVEWNFQKFMIDEQGHIVDFVLPKEDPFCDKIVKWIEADKE